MMPPRSYVDDVVAAFSCDHKQFPKHPGCLTFDPNSISKSMFMEDAFAHHYFGLV